MRHSHSLFHKFWGHLFGAESALVQAANWSARRPSAVVCYFVICFSAYVDRRSCSVRNVANARTRIILKLLCKFARCKTNLKACRTLEKYLNTKKIKDRRGRTAVCSLLSFFVFKYFPKVQADIFTGMYQHGLNRKSKGATIIIIFFMCQLRNLLGDRRFVTAGPSKPEEV